MRWRLLVCPPALLLLALASCGEEATGPSPSPAPDVAHGIDVEEALAALDDGDPAVRVEAVGRLEKASDTRPEVVAALARALTDENRWVREGAAKALGVLGEGAAPAVAALTRALHDRDSFVRWRAAKALAGVGPAAAAALPVLEEAAESPDETELGRHWAQEAVRRITSPTAPPGTDEGR